MHREIKSLRNELDELVYEDNQRNDAYDELRDQNNVLRLRNEEVTSKISEITRENEELSERLDSLKLKEETYKHKIKCIETHSTGCDDSVQRMQIKVERLVERENSLEQEILSHVKKESEREQQCALMSHTMETLKRNNETCNEQRTILQQEIKSLQLQIRDHEERNADRRTEAELRSQMAELCEQLEHSEEKRLELQNKLFAAKQNLTENNHQSFTTTRSNRMMINNKSSRIDDSNTTSSIMHHKQFNSSTNDHLSLNWREEAEEQAVTTTCESSDLLYKGEKRIRTRDEALVEDLIDQRNR